MAFNTGKRSDVNEYGNYSEPTQISRSFLGKSLEIKGAVISDEDVIIEGKVNGRLTISKTLTVGKEGYIQGEISASQVRIAGTVNGILAASQKLEISAEGKFNGNICAEKIIVCEGAQLKGTINLEEIPPTQSVDPADTTELPAVDLSEIKIADA